VIAAARAWKLPEAHVKFLETFSPRAEAAQAPRPRAIVSPAPVGGLKKT